MWPLILSTVTVKLDTYSEVAFFYLVIPEVSSQMTVFTEKPIRAGKTNVNWNQKKYKKDKDKVTKHIAILHTTYF